MDDDQQFCLRWNNHQSTLISVFDTLLEKGIHVDCTLAAEGQTLKAHKVVLSACSPYFESVLSQQYDKHPIIILKDVKFAELRAMMDYMYRGEVNISQDQLAALLKAAESLQIKGLSDSKPPPRPSSPVHKARVLDSSAGSRIHSREGSSSPLHRKRKKPRRNSTNDTNDSEALSNSIAPPEHIPAHNHTGAAPAVAPPPKPPPPPPEMASDAEAAVAKPKAEANDSPKIKSDVPLEPPKGEVCEEGTEDSVEDLTLDEEVDSEGEQTGAGPSHPQGDCVQSFAWHMDRSQDEGIPMDGQRDTQAAKSTAEEKKLPVDEKKPPFVEKKSPVVEKKLPVVEKKSPVVEKKSPVEEIKKSGKEPNNSVDVDIIEEVFSRTTPLTRGILRGTKYKPPLQKITRKRKSTLKKNTILKLQAKVLKKGLDDSALPSALLSLLTARRLQSGMNALPSVLARRAHEASVKSINLLPPDVVRNFSDNIEKARLIQQSILQMSQGGAREADAAKCEDGESDYEDYDDTDDILLPDESEVFYGSKAFSVREDQNSPYLFVDIKPDVHNSSSDSGHSPRSVDDGTRMFECRHCGKKYRWKSTLRRHENVECGGKAPSHQCPYCAYKAKQRGNLGVHIRKHHVKEWSIYASNKIRKSKKDAS